VATKGENFCVMSESKGASLPDSTVLSSLFLDPVMLGKSVHPIRDSADIMKNCHFASERVIHHNTTQRQNASAFPDPGEAAFADEFSAAWTATPAK
jgi:hypothetical protein